MEELDVMREQLSALKQQLNTQQIINKELMRKIMRRKSSWLNKLVNVELVSIPVLVLIIAVACAGLGVSQWFTAIYGVLCVVDVALDWKYVRIPSEMFSASMVDFKRFLLHQKKARFVQTAVMLVLSIAWLFGFCYAIFMAGGNEYFRNNPEAAWYLTLITGGVGCIVAVIVVVIVYLKMQRTNDALLRDLRELEDGSTVS